MISTNSSSGRGEGRLDSDFERCKRPGVGGLELKRPCSGAGTLRVSAFAGRSSSLAMSNLCDNVGLVFDAGELGGEEPNAGEPDGEEPDGSALAAGERVVTVEPDAKRDVPELVERAYTFSHFLLSFAMSDVVSWPADALRFIG